MKNQLLVLFIALFGIGTLASAQYSYSGIAPGYRLFGYEEPFVIAVQDYQGDTTYSRNAARKLHWIAYSGNNTHVEAIGNERPENTEYCHSAKRGITDLIRSHGYYSGPHAIFPGFSRTSGIAYITYRVEYGEGENTKLGPVGTTQIGPFVYPEYLKQRPGFIDKSFIYSRTDLAASYDSMLSSLSSMANFDVWENAAISFAEEYIEAYKMNPVDSNFRDWNTSVGNANSYVKDEHYTSRFLKKTEHGRDYPPAGSNMFEVKIMPVQFEGGWNLFIKNISHSYDNVSIVDNNLPMIITGYPCIRFRTAGFDRSFSMRGQDQTMMIDALFRQLPDESEASWYTPFSDLISGESGKVPEMYVIKLAEFRLSELSQYAGISCVNPEIIRDTAAHPLIGKTSGPSGTITGPEVLTPTQRQRALNLMGADFAGKIYRFYSRICNDVHEERESHGNVYKTLRNYHKSRIILGITPLGVGFFPFVMVNDDTLQ